MKIRCIYIHSHFKSVDTQRAASCCNVTHENLFMALYRMVKTKNFFMPLTGCNTMMYVLTVLRNCVRKGMNVMLA